MPRHDLLDSMSASTSEMRVAQDTSGTTVGMEAGRHLPQMSEIYVEGIVDSEKMIAA